MLLMSELGCAKPLYAVFANGLCYGYVHGQCLDVDLVRDQNVNQLIAAEMAKIHTVVPSGKLLKAILIYFHLKLMDTGQSVFDFVPSVALSVRPSVVPLLRF